MRTSNKLKQVGLKFEKILVSLFRFQSFTTWFLMFHWLVTVLSYDSHKRLCFCRNLFPPLIKSASQNCRQFYSFHQTPRLNRLFKKFWRNCLGPVFWWEIWTLTFFASPGKECKKLSANDQKAFASTNNRYCFLCHTLSYCAWTLRC